MSLLLSVSLGGYLGDSWGWGGVQEAHGSPEEWFWGEAGALGSPFMASCSWCGAASRPELLGCFKGP